MTPVEIDRVFGRGRLRMTTGEHVEVFREDAGEGEGRRYTKRFLETASGDFRPWTEREWRILARLGERGDAAVAKVVRFFAADDGGTAQLETRDAGPTVDQWATLVPLRRTAPVLPGVFGDCAHWWALARQCLLAFDPLHALGFVHLDFKADNVCIPWHPAQSEHPAAGQPLAPDFEGLALIDVAFSLLPEVELPAPLPLAREPGYEYQSPRLLNALDEGRRGNVAAALELDWRADIFSLAALLWHLLPEIDDAAGTGWNSPRHASATAFVRRLLDIHDAPFPAERPHRQLIGLTSLRLNDPQLAAALQAPSTFDPDRAWRQRTEATPLTRVVATRPVAAQGRHEPVFVPRAPAVVEVDIPVGMPDDAEATLARYAATAPVAAGVAAAVTAATAPAAPPRAAEAATALSPSATSVVAAVGRAVDSTPVASPKPEPASAAATAPSVSKAAPDSASGGAAPARWTPPWLVRPAPGVADLPTTTPAAPSAAPTRANLAPPTIAKAAPPITAKPAPQPLETSIPKRATDDVPSVAAGAPPPLQELPQGPARTRVPVLAAAGAGALLVALAAWWTLDGRATLERMAARGLPAGSAVATIEPALPATVPAAVGATTAAAPPATAAAPPATAAAPTTAAAPPTSAVATASRAADSGAPAGSPARTVGSASELESAADAWMKNRMPRIAQAAERQLAPVLAAASRSAELRRRGDVRAAMQRTRPSAAVMPDAQADAGQARELNEAAMAAYWRDSNVADAVRLQTQAFGANPLDPEIAGNLAFLRLKEPQPQAEAARRLALHALTLKDARFPTGRIEDWTTLAIAAALTGRENDARNAWFASMALAADLQRQCNAAVRAQAIYGERLRPSVRAMLQRARSSAAYGGCEVAQTAKQASAQKAAPDPPAATRKPARKTAGKGKSRPRSRNTIP